MADKKVFYFNTGVNLSKNPNPCLFPSPNNIGLIPFQCEDVPDDAVLMMACNNDQEFWSCPDVIVRKIYPHDGPWSQMLSEYAYFRINLQTYAPI